MKNDKTEIRDLSDSDLNEQIELFRNRLETLSDYISETEDAFTRSNMQAMLPRYKLTLDALLQERQNRATFLENNTSIDLEDFLFKSSDHLRYENGTHVSGPHGGAARAVKIERNVSGLSGYTVTIYNIDGDHPVWQNNVQMAPKQMKIISTDNQKIVLRGFGQDMMGGQFSDYGLSIIHDNGKVNKCILHMHDRNIDIEYQG